MATIVEYSDGKRPENRYPQRITSPTQSGPCCFSGMDTIGEVGHAGRFTYQYRRCRRCGFTVRFILQVDPDGVVLDALREKIVKSFSRHRAPE
jgi:hypothetical protein